MTTPAWSPDGTKIAFASNRDGNHEIYVMNADGSGADPADQQPGGDDCAGWSPDGSKIAFISTRDGNPEIYVMNADGTGAAHRRTTRATSSQPGRRTAEIAFRPRRQPEIYAMNADGTGQTQDNLTSNPGADDYQPSWGVRGDVSSGRWRRSWAPRATTC